MSLSGADRPPEVSGPLDGEFASTGFSVVAALVPPQLIAALSDATDRAVASESTTFPPCDDQHGRVLFAPAHGGAFLELCAFDPVFAPIEELLGADSIIYTMTTSVLEPGSAGPIDRYHVDLTGDRPDGLALAAMVMLDPFTAETGATEFVPGSHRLRAGAPDDRVAGRILTGEPGDVCFFDPRVHHRSTRNRSDRPRRAVLFQMIRPWMKQRFDVGRMLGERSACSLEPVVARRLGLTSVPPGSVEEFVQRRGRRPW
jgi:ectoine hydroxylase-related dioxygenase (phytanoyl-CoA dioxygenase family)